MRPKTFQWLAIVLIVITGYLHLITAGEEYAEARYMGVLFLANFLGALVSAVGILRRKLWWGWILGVVIAAGSIIGYIQSRTVGMPGMEVEEWYDPIGIPAMIVEGMFLIVFVLAKPWSASVSQKTSHSDDDPASRPSVRLFAMSLLLSIGALHLLKTVRIYESAKDICGLSFAVSKAGINAMIAAGMPAGVAYAGLLFPMLLLASVVSAWAVYRRNFWLGWVPGIFITAGTFWGYAQLRAVTFPGVGVNGWLDPIRVAMILEGVFLVLLVWSNAGIANALKQSPIALPNAANRQPAYVMASVLALVAVSAISYQLGARNSHNEHPLPETVISNDTLEQEYGIRLTLVAVTAAGGLVDVRYRIIDPVKAAQLVDEQDGGIMPMVYVGNGDVMLMPDSHMRNQKLIADRMYFNLIPNTQSTVKRGSVVTIVFGDVALEPVLAQ
jgi:hypothetical protein